MKVIFANKKTGKSNKFVIRKDNINDLRNIVLQIDMTRAQKTFNVMVQSENENDDAIIYHGFNGIRTPTQLSKKSLWVGDDAKFIIINYPKDAFET